MERVCHCSLDLFFVFCFLVEMPARQPSKEKEKKRRERGKEHDRLTDRQTDKLKASVYHMKKRQVYCSVGGGAGGHLLSKEAENKGKCREKWAKKSGWVKKRPGKTDKNGADQSGHAIVMTVHSEPRLAK